MTHTLQSLPSELLIRIFSDSSLDLIDLARTSLACPSLAPVTRLAAESHAQRRIISNVLGRRPEDILCILVSNDAGQSGWLSLTEKADLQPLTRKYWDSFGDRDLEAGIQVRQPSVNDHDGTRPDRLTTLVLLIHRSCYRSHASLHP